MGPPPAQINGPSGLAIDSEDNVYVVRPAQRPGPEVHSRRLADSGMGASQAAGRGSSTGPGAYASTQAGNVYVADWRNDRIQKLSPDGEPIMQLGDPGEEPGQLQRPAGVAVTDDGYIAVADWGNERVQIFDSEGRFVKLMQGQATLSKWAEEFLAANPDEAGTRAMSDLTPELPDHLQSPLPRRLPDRALLLGSHFGELRRTRPPVCHRVGPAPLPGIRTGLGGSRLSAEPVTYASTSRT